MTKPKDFHFPETATLNEVFLHERLLYVPQKGLLQKPSYIDFSKSDFFNNKGPLQIEYCSGNGAWIYERAKINPNINFIAVEKRLDRCRKIWSKLHNAKLSNLIVAWAECLCLTRLFIKDESVATIFINFPDPWPKRRHVRFRLIQEPFISEMARILQPNCHLIITTDDADYSEFIIKNMAQSKKFTNCHPERGYSEPPIGWGSSYFEELFRSKGMPIRFHEFCRAFPL